MENKHATVSLADVIKDKKLGVTKPSKTNEWQLKALDYAQKLGIDLKKIDKRLLAQWFKFFKQYSNDGKTDTAYSYMADYQKDLPMEGKVKMFFWKFNHSKISS